MHGRQLLLHLPVMMVMVVMVMMVVMRWREQLRDCPAQHVLGTAARHDRSRLLTVVPWFASAISTGATAASRAASDLRAGMVVAVTARIFRGFRLTGRKQKTGKQQKETGR